MLKSNSVNKDRQTIFKVTAKNSKLLAKNANLEKKNANLEKKNANLEKKNTTLNQKVNSKSYKLGHLILHKTRSISSLLKFPKRVYSIWQSKTQKQNSETRQAKNQISEQKKPSTPKKNPTLNLNAIQLPQKNISPIVVPHIHELKIACIMDTFTYSVFEPEAHFHQLTPEDWLTEIASIDPDMLFVESAWRGKDDLWKGKVAILSQELVDIIAHCQKNKIITIFWNKEDPFHFDEFINTAKYFDYVFTTDNDMIVKYKETCTHDRIYLLPFACQPKIHNPIEKYTRKDAFSFAGAFYPNFQERSKIFESFIENLIPMGDIDIFDRNHNNPTSPFQYPPEYEPYIRGTLDYNKIDKAYKGYRYSINMSTITDSSSMFARRVFELAASNTMIISNYAKGIKNLFGDLVISTDDGKELATLLSEYREHDGYEDKVKLLALRKVMMNHTSSDRLNFITSKLTQKTIHFKLPSITLIAYIASDKSLAYAIEVFNKQSIENKRLILICNDSMNLNLSKDPNIAFYYENEDTTIAQVISEDDQYIAGISTDDYYAENYLMDLILATRYSESMIIGKGSYFQLNETQDIELMHKEVIFKTTSTLSARSSIIQCSYISGDKINQFVKELSSMEYNYPDMLAIDAYNYCKDGLKNGINSVNKEIVSDLININSGIK